MHIALIGGAGFIGMSVARALLNAACNVRVIDTEERLLRIRGLLCGCELLSVEYPQLDGIEEYLDSVDTLVHLASTTDPASSMRSLAHDARSNIVASMELFDIAIRKGVGKIVFASSGGTVYGSPVRLPATEDCPTSPLCAYGVSKRAIESYLSILASSRSVTGISLRVSNPYGPAQFSGATVGVIARFLANMHKGLPLEVWGDGSVVRDYLHIEDVASAFSSAVCATDLPSGVYNVGSGVGTSINQIINEIQLITERLVDIRYRSTRGFDVPAIVLDTTKFFGVTGWRPTIGLQEGIRLMHGALEIETDATRG